MPFFPQRQEPIYINWHKSPTYGLRLSAYTDAEGIAYIGMSELDAAGQPIEEIDYFPSFTWRTTVVVDGHESKFWAVVDNGGLRMFYKDLSEKRALADFCAVLWGSENREENF